MSNPISVSPLKAFSDNYIWSIESGSNCIVVDPGQAEPVLAYLQQNQLTLQAILITHHHWDHIDGIDELLSYYSVPVYGPDTRKIPQVTHKLNDGDKLSLFDHDLTLSVMTVPGHTRDHIAYYGQIASEPAVFCGDTLFAAGCGRRFDGSYAQFTESLQNLAALPSNTLVYCTHEYTLANLNFAQAVEPDNLSISERIETETVKRQQDQPTLPSTIALEQATNPFLRYQHQGVKDAINQHWQTDWSSDVELFTGLRQWKDNF